MTVRELKKRIEELDVSDDDNVCFIQRTSFKDPIAYRPNCISKSFSGDLMIVTYEEGMTVSSHDY